MTRTLIVTFLLCAAVCNPASGDYSLPDVQERLVLLLDLRDVSLDKRGLVFSVNERQQAFKVDRFWMQSRIWSDGICVGVQDTNPRSSASRIREVQRALARKEDSLLLVELVSVEKTSRFFVSYLKLFDPETEYGRYYPKRAFYDTIEMPLGTKPKDSRNFVEELKKCTEEARERIRKRKPAIRCPSTDIG